MAAVPRRSSRRAGRVLLAGVVTVAHIAAFLVLSLSQPRETPPETEPAPQTFAVSPLSLPAPGPPLSSSVPPRTAREKRERQKTPALAAASPGWTLPATGSHGPAAGELADSYAVREALRGSVGCDMETLELRPDEQARCAARTGRWARKGRKIGPAEDDPKWAAELAAEEDFQRRRHEWTTTDCGIHNAHDELDEKGTLGQYERPHRGAPKDGEEEARRNAC